MLWHRSLSAESSPIFSSKGVYCLCTLWIATVFSHLIYFEFQKSVCALLKTFMIHVPFEVILCLYQCNFGSSVGRATDYRLDGPGIECQWGQDFPPVQTGPGAHPASCTMGTGSFLGVKCGRGVLLTTHPLLVPRSWKSRAIPLPTLWATPGL